MFLQSVLFRKKQLAGLALLATCFLLDLFFSHKDGGDMFLQNISEIPPDYIASYPRG
jgi:hypothetical protein